MLFKKIKSYIGTTWFNNLIVFFKIKPNNHRAEYAGKSKIGGRPLGVDQLVVVGYPSKLRIKSGVFTFWETLSFHFKSGFDGTFPFFFVVDIWWNLQEPRESSRLFFFFFHFYFSASFFFFLLLLVGLMITSKDKSSISKKLHFFNGTMNVGRWLKNPQTHP